MDDRPHDSDAHRDPWAEAPEGHQGAAKLRDAADLLASGDDPARAAGAAAEARSLGLPAELAPTGAIVEGAALLLAGNAANAITVLADCWCDHPDVAALPALLGAAQAAGGDDRAAARTLLAALASEDLDGSLVLHRRTITAVLAHLQRAY